MSFSLYAIAANLIYHCVLASKSRQTKPRCSSSDKKKREVNRWCFFLLPTACLVDFELHFLYVLCTFHPCDTVQLASCFCRFHVIFFTWFCTTHIHTHTLCKRRGWKFLRCFPFCRAFACRVFCVLSARFECWLKHCVEPVIPWNVHTLAAT